MSDKNHLMIDVETLDVGTFPALLSIGAVAFNPYEMNNFEEFYVDINAQTCIDLDATVSWSTIQWWLTQNQEARYKIAKAENPQHIITAVKDLETFIKDNKIKYVWGHGATFDPVIMDNYFKKLNLATPWKYYNARDTRTIFDLCEIKRTKMEGVRHNALDDAKVQAIDVQRCYIGFKNIMDIVEKTKNKDNK